MKSRLWFGRLWLACLSPVVFFFLLEGLFALTGFFSPVHLIKKVLHQGREYWTTNHDYGRMVFSRESAPLPGHLWMPVAKTEGTRRVVLLGESAAAGFPTPEFNLARLVQVMWNDLYPDQPVEVANLTMTGVNSHMLHLFAREAMAMKPDLLILFAGHNEVIGPYGPASVFGRHHASLRFIRFHQFLSYSRVGRSLEAARHHLGRWSKGHRTRWQGLDEFANRSIANNDVRLDAVAGHLHTNVRKIINIGVSGNASVLVAVPPVNLNDWPPLKSENDTGVGDNEDSSSALTIEQSTTSAWRAYQLAKTREAEHDWDAAWRLYRKALDLDLYRFRADSRVRQVLLNSSQYFQADPVRVLDIDRAMHEENPEFVTDREYFFEHVHLTFEGLSFAALAIVQEMSRLWAPNIDPVEIANYNDEYWRKKLLYTDIEDLRAWSQITRFFHYDVFVTQPDVDQRRSAIKRKIEQLQGRVEEAWTSDRIDRWYERATNQSPADVMLHFIAGRLYMHRHESERAMAAFERTLNAYPRHPDALFNLIRLQIEHRHYVQAGQTLEQMWQVLPNYEFLNAISGDYYTQIHNYGKARLFLQKAVAQNADDYGSWLNLASICQMQDKTNDSIQALRQCIRLNPDDALSMNNLAWLLATKRSSKIAHQEALVLAQRAVSRDPLAHRFRGTMALALALNGLDNEARNTANQAIARARAAGDHEAVAALNAALANAGLPR